MEAINTQVAAKVKQAMDVCGTTGDELATLTGISRTTLHRSLTGSRSFTVGELWDIAHHLGVTIVDLLPPARDMPASA